MENAQLQGDERAKQRAHHSQTRSRHHPIRSERSRESTRPSRLPTSSRAGAARRCRGTRFGSGRRVRRPRESSRAADGVGLVVVRLEVRIPEGLVQTFDDALHGEGTAGNGITTGGRMGSHAALDRYGGGHERQAIITYGRM